MADEQYHFDFLDWKKAFAMFYRKRIGEKIFSEDGRLLGRTPINPKLCLLISTGEYNSGYSLEEDPKSDKHTIVYRSVRAVRNLEREIEENERKKANHEMGIKAGLIS